MTGSRKLYHALIVDDESCNLDLLGRRLDRCGYEVSLARSAREAAGILAARLPDIILLDINMPEVSGVELLRQLRNDPATQAIPIIMVSAADDTATIVSALKLGANDYVTKPINIHILQARMETHLRLAAMVMNLEMQKRLLSTAAAYDELTGIYNRRSLFEALESELARSRRYNQPLSVLMLDIDFFKRINDTFGHAAGDDALCEVTRRLGGALRSVDVLGRYGGEEFCVILPEAGPESSLKTAERLRLSVAQTPFRIEGTDISITLSVGAATRPPDGIEDSKTLIQMADSALLECKRTGRNRAQHFTQVQNP